MKKSDKDPFSWDNITIEKYYQIMDVLNDDCDDDITKNVKIVSILMDKDEQEIWDMDMTEAGGYINRLKFLNKFDIPDHPNMKFNIGGYNLEVIKDVTKINVAQYVDFQNFVKLPLREGMDKILSIFLIPKDHKYNEGYDILDVQRVIRENMSFRVAEGLLGFFLRKYGKSLIRSQIYCRRQIRKTKDTEMMEMLKEAEKEIMKKLDSLTALVGCS